MACGVNLGHGGSISLGRRTRFTPSKARAKVSSEKLAYVMYLALMSYIIMDLIDIII